MGELSGFIFYIPKNIKYFTFIEQIECGSFSSVALTKKEGTSELFSSKIIPIEFLIQRKMLDVIYREIGFLSILTHENIIHCYESFKTPDDKCLIIVLEHYKGDLFKYIFSDTQIDQKTKKKIAYQILLAVAHLHYNSIAHRDIKPENILIGKGKILLTDFGFACYCHSSPKTNDHKATRAFAGPEFFSNNEVDSFKMDIFAIGLTLMVLSTRDKKFYKFDNMNLESRALQMCELEIDKNDEIQVLAKPCLNKDPEKRPSIEDLLNDNCFKNL